MFFDGAFLVTGVLCIFALMSFASAWFFASILKYCKVWYVMWLGVSIRLHDKDFSDNQFWWAIQERASRSQFAAQQIAAYALKYAPKVRS